MHLLGHFSSEERRIRAGQLQCDTVTVVKINPPYVVSLYCYIMSAQDEKFISQYSQRFSNSAAFKYAKTWVTELGQ